MSVANLTQLANKHIGQFAHPIPFTILDTLADFGALANVKVDPDTIAKGVTVDRHIYLFREALHGVADAIDTIFHEVLHFGLHRALSREQFIKTMDGLYSDDQYIRVEANKWMRSQEGIDLRAEESFEFVRARGVDEALANMAHRVITNESGYAHNRVLDSIRRSVLRAIKFIAQALGFDGYATRMKAATNDEARALIKEIFAGMKDGTIGGRAGFGGAAYSRTDPAPVNLHPAVAPKTGLLDTPMRLAFQKTGALVVWRGAFHLLEKTANTALDNKVGEVIKAGMIDRYGLSDAVIERHEEMRVKQIAGVRTADRFLEHLAGLSRQEYAVLYAAADNADMDSVNDMIAELPEDSQKALHEIKALVRELGQDAVDLKMLDHDTFKANEMAYLHRSYVRHKADLTEGEKANRSTRIKGDQFRQRGLADVVSSGGGLAVGSLC